MAGFVAAARSPASHDFGAEEEGKVRSADVAAALTGGSHLSVAEKKKKSWRVREGLLGLREGLACWAGPVGLAQLRPL